MKQPKEHIPLTFAALETKWSLASEAKTIPRPHCDLLLRDLPLTYGAVEIHVEDGFWRVVKDDVVLREVDPLDTRKLSCFFEEKAQINFTMDELKILLEGMYGPL